MDFVISSQTSKGDIYWAKEEGIEILDDSLITGSSSIYKSLECAIAIYNILGKPIENLIESRLSLKNSINNNPERYDRSWESKSRYSMDWYYPILAGVLNKKDSFNFSCSPLPWSLFSPGALLTNKKIDAFDNEITHYQLIKSTWEKWKSWTDFSDSIFISYNGRCMR